MKYKRAGITVIIAILCLIGVVYAHQYLQKPPLIPKSYTKQVSYIIIAPSSTSGALIMKNTMHFNTLKDDKSLYYQVSYAGTTLDFNEQATPDIFSDIPGAYDKYVSGLGRYSQFDSAIGTVNLTKKTSSGKQIAVTNSKGTLLLVQAESDLTKDQWRKLANNLVANP